MSVVAIEDVVKVTCAYAVNRKRCTINMFYSMHPSASAIDSRDVAQKWYDVVLPVLKTCLSQECKFDFVSCHGAKAETFLGVTKYLEDEEGDISEETLPSNIGVILQFRQEDVASSANGRIIIPGIPETETEDGSVKGAFATGALADFRDILLEPLEYQGGTFANLCVVRRHADGDPLEPPYGLTVAQISVNRQLHVQRRRTTPNRSVHP